MKRQSVYQATPAECPMIYAIGIIGGKWKVPIMWQLCLKDKLRFNELKRSVTGITNMMLTHCLRELEANHLVKRVQYMEIPPRVEYSLTDSARELIPSLQAMQEWAVKQIGRQESGKVPDEGMS